MDILLVVDESRNTQVEHRWLLSLVQNLEQRLLAERIGDVFQYRQCPNLYSLVGFGRRDVEAHVFRDARGLDSVSARDLIALISTLSSDVEGYVEDGYHAIEHGLERTTWRLQRPVNGPPVGRAVILVTDEDWDQTGWSTDLSRQSIRRILERSGAALHAVVDQQFVANGRDLLGMTGNNQGFMVSGGSYQQVSSAAVGQGFARTTEHYTELALGMGGSAWNILLARVQASSRPIAAAIANVLSRGANEVCLFIVIPLRFLHVSLFISS